MSAPPAAWGPPPADGAALREALYGGALVVLPPSPASEGLRALAHRLLREALGPEPRRAWARLPPDALFHALGGVRRALYLAPEAHGLLFALLTERGEDPDAWAFDPARLRVVHPHGDQDPRARAVYAIHRDTWYGHPPALLTWWIALDDLPEAQTFTTWPAAFGAEVPNDSEVFDYDAWVAQGWSLKIGWQDPDAGRRARYPGFLGDPAALGPGVGFAARAGESRLFSGAHLHGTRVHGAPTTRFSLDLRLVHLPDAAAGRGAPCPDDRSRGSALPDYLRLGQLFGEGQRGPRP